MTKAPGAVKTLLDVELDRPRTQSLRSSEEFAHIQATVAGILTGGGQRWQRRCLSQGRRRGSPLPTTASAISHAPGTAQSLSRQEYRRYLYVTEYNYR